MRRQWEVSGDWPGLSRRTCLTHLGVTSPGFCISTTLYLGGDLPYLPPYTLCREREEEKEEEEGSGNSSVNVSLSMPAPLPPQ